MTLHNFDIERDDLCSRLGGGIPKGTLVAIEGPNGAGKSIIVQRMMFGFVQHDLNISYVSTELTTKGFFDQMESLEYNLASNIAKEQIVFIPTHPAIGARAPRHERLSRLLQARQMYTKDIIVIDAFSKLLGDHVDCYGETQQSHDVIEAVLHLFKRLTGAGKTIILTLDPEQAASHTLAPFRDEADVLLDVEKKIVGSSAERRIVAQRMGRAEDRYNDVIGFRVEPGIGIVIEIKAVVG